eukprot:1161556-Pelagomonas_calceolata.AAC.14
MVAWLMKDSPHAAHDSLYNTTLLQTVRYFDTSFVLLQAQHTGVAHLVAWRLMKDSPHAEHDSCPLSFALYHNIINLELCSPAGPARWHCTLGVAQHAGIAHLVSWLMKRSPRERPTAAEVLSTPGALPPRQDEQARFGSSSGQPTAAEGLSTPGPSHPARMSRRKECIPACCQIWRGVCLQCVCRRVSVFKSNATAQVLLGFPGASHPARMSRRKECIPACCQIWRGVCLQRVCHRVSVFKHNATAQVLLGFPGPSHPARVSEQEIQVEVSLDEC